MKKLFIDYWTKKLFDIQESASIFRTTSKVAWKPRRNVKPEAWLTNDLELLWLSSLLLKAMCQRHRLLNIRISQGGNRYEVLKALLAPKVIKWHGLISEDAAVSAKQLFRANSTVFQFKIYDLLVGNYIVINFCR